MVSRNPEIMTDDRVTVRESDCLEAIIVALEGDEFVQLTDGRMRDDGNGRCVFGVSADVIRRCWYDNPDEVQRWPQWFTDAARRASALLPGGNMAAANDAGVTFAQIAQALRQAREEMRDGES